MKSYQRLILRKTHWGLLLSLVVLFTGCVNTVPLGPSSTSLEELTPRQEMILGQVAYTKLIQTNGGAYQDNELTTYVNSVGQRLVRSNQRADLQYRFAVVNNSSPNLYALPGGSVVVSRGLLLRLTCETELATLLAHAIAHISARHNLNGFSAEELRRSVVDMLNPPDDKNISFISTDPEISRLLDWQFTAAQETVAEQLANKYMLSAGYDQIGFAHLLVLLVDRSGAEQATHWLKPLIRQHPTSSARSFGNGVSSEGTTPVNVKGGPETLAFARSMVSLTLTLRGYETYDRARHLEQNGLLAEAINLYHQALLEAPDEPLILCAIGLAYLRNEDLVPARRYLIKAVNLQENYYKSRLALGYVYQQKQEYAKALQQLESGFEIFPTVEGGFMLAEVYGRVGDKESSRKLYQAVVDANAASKLGRTAAERLKQMGH